MKTEQECDVLIIGLGGAGAAAAITAREAGVNVLAVEKTDDGGGSTRDSGGSVRSFVDLELAVTHYATLTEGRTPAEVVRACVEGAIELPGWLASHGGKQVQTKYAGVESEGEIYPARHPSSAYDKVEGAGGLGPRYRVVPESWSAADGPEPRGLTLWQVLLASLVKLDIPVLYSTRAQRLLQDSAGRVVGALCDSPAGQVAIRAARAVILTCGGFADDRELKLDVFGADIPTLCAPGRRTGDGIRMAQAAGAGLWHMGALAARFGYKFPEYEAAFMATMPGPGFIIVDRDADRYLNEGRLDAHTAGLVALVPDSERTGYRRTPSYFIFDEETRYDGPLAVVRRGYNAGFPWSRDNSREIKRGWISSADSIPELAGQLNLSPGSLARAVEQFNAAANKELPDAYGRSPETMRPIATPPYYGVAIWPSIINTQGGPRRDERARVLDPFGMPIPGLYSAGELGSMWSTFYPGAGNVTEALVYGQIAGREAAAAQPLA